MEKARNRNVNGYILVTRQVCWNTWEHTVDSWPSCIRHHSSCTLCLRAQHGRSSKNYPGQAKWPSHCSACPLTSSWGFSGIFVSRAPSVLKDVRTWATIAPLTNLGLTSVGGCWARCTQPTHCQEVVLAFVHAPGYFTECHHLVMKYSPVTMAHEHRNSLCP